MKTIIPLLFGVIIASLFLTGANSITCGDNYLCTPDPKVSDLVWVMSKEGNVNGPDCSAVCSAVDSLCTTTGNLYNCQPDAAMFHSKDSFAQVAQGLGFHCVDGGCWNSQVQGGGQIWVSINQNNGNRTCYFPPSGSNGFQCLANPGNANCFGERYALVCPCTKRTMNTMCNLWDSPPNDQKTAKWPTDVKTGNSCLARINYWRQVACEQGWPECPPCGLPPVVECVGCHACVNSEAEYDSIHGAHSSFTRCGENVQGEGGGSSCGAVIDSFVAERQVFPDSNGQVVCRGHCGPIVHPGCFSFQWGKNNASSYTLNWRSCNADTCDAYCDNPTSNKCFLNKGEKAFPGTGSGGGNTKSSGGGGKTSAASTGFIPIFAVIGSTLLLILNFIF